MDTHNWLLTQVLFSSTAILVNIVLFHLLNSKKLDDNNGPNLAAITNRIIQPRRAATLRLGMLKRFGMSLSFLHVFSGACLLVITVTSLLTHHISGFYPSLGHVEIFTLLMTLTSTMFHLLGIMINDFKATCRVAVLSGENNFYLILTWTSTLICTVMLFLVRVDGDITKLLSYIFLATDTFLLLSYIEIIRRAIVNRRAAVRFYNQVALYNSVQQSSASGSVNGLSSWHSHYNHIFLGILLLISFVMFSVPFALERFLWKQNFMVSYICVSLNSISQGVIFGVRMYVK